MGSDLSPKHMSVQNGAMDVRQSDATGRMRLTSVFCPAHVCVHSTTQARSQDFPRGGGSYSGEKWTLRLKGGGSHLVKMWTFVRTLWSLWPKG